MTGAVDGESHTKAKTGAVGDTSRAQANTSEAVFYKRVYQEVERRNPNASPQELDNMAAMLVSDYYGSKIFRCCLVMEE